MGLMMPVKKILIVDDDPHIRSIITQVVKRSGHSYHTAADGVEALSLIQKHTFDIIISDISMPRMSGLELMRKPESVPPKPLSLLSPVILKNTNTIKSLVPAPMNLS